MDAPDAPLDPNTAKGQAEGDRYIDAAGALSTPCVPRSIAERMASGTLSTEEIRGPGRQLVRHLLRGCPDCAVAFGLAAGWRAVTRPLPLFHYEARVNSGIRQTMEDWRGREVAKALIAEARKLRREDPEFGIEVLEEALRRVGMAGESLACEIHTERANLLRLLGRHREAELAFQAAIRCRQKGVGAAETLLNLGDQYGSFLIARRRFGEADGLLARLVATLSQRGNLAHAGRLNIKRSLAAAYSGDPGRALRLAYEALHLLHGAEETLELRLNALQLSIAWNVELGNFQDASDCADRIRTEYHRHMGEGDRAKFVWLDAQIYDGLRRHNVAEKLFRRVKAQFEQLGLPFQAALVGLDLAVNLIDRRRSAEARALIAGELIPTFRSVGVAREGIASLVLLERATEAAALDAALLKGVLRDLERAGQKVGTKRREDDENDEVSDFE